MHACIIIENMQASVSDIETRRMRRMLSCYCLAHLLSALLAARRSRQLAAPSGRRRWRRLLCTARTPTGG